MVPTPYLTIYNVTSNAPAESGSQPMPHFMPAFLLFLAQPGLAQYVRRHFLDTTFKGLYEANGFDLALLIPYFIVLILLASYGVHRYTLVYLYYRKKNRENHGFQE